MYYNRAIAALRYEYESKSKDIGKWEVYYQEKNYYGEGIKELKDFTSTLPQDRMNVIYVKDVKLLFIVNGNEQNYVFTDGKLRSEGLNNFDFFTLQSENIEFREWNNLFKDCENCEEFVKSYYYATKYFNYDNVEKFGVYTLSHDAYKHGLLWRYADYIGVDTHRAMAPIVKKCIPKDEFVLNFYETYYRGGMTFYNIFMKDRIMKDVVSYDKKSCHLAAMCMERFPLTDFVEIDVSYFKDVVNDFDNTAFIADLYFEDLHQKPESYVSNNTIYQFGGHEDVNGIWNIRINEIDWKWFKEEFSWRRAAIKKLYVAPKSYLPTNVIRAFVKLYEEKEIQIKGSLARTFAKQVTELPYGQSIKRLEYEYEAEITEEGVVEVRQNDELSLEEKQKVLAKRRFPLQLGIWTVSYSRLDIWKSVQITGADKCVYCDTDCNKSICDPSIVKELNKEIEDKCKQVKKICNVDLPNTMGRWAFEYKADEFVVTGIKWYAYTLNGQKYFKAAGAQLDKVTEWFKTHELKDFNAKAEIDGLFKTVEYNIKKGYAKISYNSYFCEQFISEQKLYYEVRV